MTGLLLEPIYNASSTSVFKIANRILHAINPSASTSTVIAADADEAWFLSESWQSGEREVDAHVLRGEIRVFDDAASLFARLDELALEG